MNARLLIALLCLLAQLVAPLRALGVAPQDAAVPLTVSDRLGDGDAQWAFNSTGSRQLVDLLRRLPRVLDPVTSVDGAALTVALGSARLRSLRQRCPAPDSRWRHHAVAHRRCGSDPPA